MVDRADVDRANGLIGDYRQTVRALTNLEEGGRIIAMTIGPSAVTVPTDDLNYPVQMVDAIRQALVQRRDAIQQQLNEIGVTGEEPPPWPPTPDETPPEPMRAPAQAAPPPRPQPPQTAQQRQRARFARPR